MGLTSRWFEHRNRGGAGAFSADEPMLSTRVIAVNLSTGAVAHLYEGGPDVNLFRGDEANETPLIASDYAFM